MGVRMYTEGPEPLLLDRQYPEGFVPRNGPLVDRSTPLELPGCRGAYRELYFDDLLIGYSEFDVQRETTIHFESRMSAVEMHFALGGDSRTDGPALGEGIPFRPAEHNIIHTREVSGSMRLSPSFLRVFEVNMTPAYFLRFFGEGDHPFGHFVEAVMEGHNAMLRSTHGRMDAEMHRLVRAILGCQRTGAFKRLFVEAKVAELLLLQMEHFAAEQGRPLVPHFGDHIDRMHAAREYMLAHLDTPCSLLELAHAVGTNEFTLKRAFRSVFGTTVHAFWSDLRMDMALEELRDSADPVAVISLRAGYKNPQHFSTAFKRRFGVSPSALRGRK